MSDDAYRSVVVSKISGNQRVAEANRKITEVNEHIKVSGDSYVGADRDIEARLSAVDTIELAARDRRLDKRYVPAMIVLFILAVLMLASVLALILGSPSPGCSCSAPGSC